MNTSQSNFSEEERYLAYAVLLWEKGDWESAYLAYEKAIKVNPDSYQGYCGKGYVEQDLKQYENSLESYSIAIKIKSDYADAYINRATVYFLLNDLEQATRDAKIAESLYLNQGNQAGYLRSKDMIETLKKEKDNLPADTSQGDSLDGLLKDFSDYMEEIYKSYELVDPKVERGMTNRVHQQEQKSKNQTQIEKAAQFYNEGNIRANMGMFEDALSMYDKAISLDRSNPMYFNNRAASLKRLGRFQESIDQYKQIACEFPAYGKILALLSSR
ncbi:MAG: tetratricopeptide repeat protein [Prochlorotrichaceae cyanobacterium]|jgi:tetratricopeptide (TPR) repeat protein